MNDSGNPAAGASDGSLEPVFTGLRLALGLLFLAGGLYLYYIVLTSLSALINGVSSFPLVDKFTSAEARTLTLPHLGEQIALPPVFFSGMGYGVLALLGSIVVSIGNNLLRAAVGLLQPDARVLIRRLSRELKK